jgi:hypothetical protein
LIHPDIRDKERLGAVRFGSSALFIFPGALRYRVATRLVWDALGDRRIALRARHFSGTR